jgi:hypothetical protein
MRALLHVLCATFMALAAFAQTDALPEVPEDGIRDEARTLQMADKAALAAELKHFSQKTGFQFYVDTNAFLLGNEGAWQRARGLINHWIKPGQPGVVLCVNRGASVVPVLQFSQAAQALFPGGELEMLGREMAVNVDAVIRPEHKMPVAMRTVTQRITHLMEQRQRHKQALTAGEGKLALLLTLGLAVLAILSAWMLGRIDKDELSALTQFEFPAVDVGQRFGSPCGGGVLAEIDFSRE